MEQGKACYITAGELTTLSPALTFIKEVELSNIEQMGARGFTELAKASVKANGEATQKGKVY